MVSVAERLVHSTRDNYVQWDKMKQECRLKLFSHIAEKQTMDLNFLKISDQMKLPDFDVEGEFKRVDDLYDGFLQNTKVEFRGDKLVLGAGLKSKEQYCIDAYRQIEAELALKFSDKFDSLSTNDERNRFEANYRYGLDEKVKGYGVMLKKLRKKLTESEGLIQKMQKKVAKKNRDRKLRVEGEVNRLNQQIESVQQKVEHNM